MENGHLERTCRFRRKRDQYQSLFFVSLQLITLFDPGPLVNTKKTFSTRNQVVSVV